MEHFLNDVGTMAG